LTGDVGTGGLAIEGRDIPPSGERPHAAQRQVDPGYFAVMGMTITRGRAFTAADGPGSAPVAIVNETAARTFWPGTDPIGQRLRPDGTLWLTIVGVVKDVRYAALSAPPGPEVYWPYAFAPSPVVHIVMHSRTPAPLLSASVRREVRQLDARLPALWISTLDDLVAESVAESRLLLVLLALFAAFGLIVSAGGIYGVTSYLVAHRRQDLAVRLALGASRSRLIGATLTEGVTPVVIGVSIGLGAATGLSPLLAQHLFEVSTSDALTLAAAPALLIAAALAACYGPAWRASRVEPLAALRAE
jgi:putative ABC transport system permease protein